MCEHQHLHCNQKHSLADIRGISVIISHSILALGDLNSRVNKETYKYSPCVNKATTYAGLPYVCQGLSSSTWATPVTRWVLVALHVMIM